MIRALRCRMDANDRSPLLHCLLGNLQIGRPLRVTLQGLDSFPIILGHHEQALPLEVEGSYGRVLSAGALQSAEFL